MLKKQVLEDFKESFHPFHYFYRWDSQKASDYIKPIGNLKINMNANQLCAADYFESCHSIMSALTFEMLHAHKSAFYLL